VSVSLLPLGGPLRIAVSGERPGLDTRIESAWVEACGRNPRLFDGEILAVASVDAAAGVVLATPERFAHVVCPRPGRPTTILSVTGVIESVLDGERCVLLAQRGASTRSYPGMWEFAPAGGLQVSRSALDLEGVLVTLRAELREEVGVTAALHEARAVALVLDEAASSLDVVVRASVRGPAPALSIAGEHAWECARARWVPLEGVASFLLDAPGGVIEPTWAIARFLGWVSAR
jgi:8-oxo-dGTP pyrophosphatase MutT (NUDIX family)